MQGDISEHYSGKTAQPLIPLIFSHGLSSNRTMHSGTCKDFASHGYIVFVMDHKDGSSSYTEEAEGHKGLYYDNTIQLYDLDSRRGQVDIRVSEIKALIDELYQDQGASILERIGFPRTLKLDLERLIISGHSFGGMTAIRVANEDPRVKVCGTLDPWLFTFEKEITTGQFQLP